MGSSKYLVFAKSAATNPPPNAPLYVTTGHGHARRIGTLTAEDGVFSLAGSMLVYEHSVMNPSGTDTLTLHWRNLRTNAHGAVSVPSGLEIIAAPDGWVTTPQTQGEDRHTLTLHTTNGHTTSLGRPRVRSPVLFMSVSRDILVIDAGDDDDYNGDGSAVAMSFAHPGHFHQLVAARPYGWVSCTSVTNTRIACLSGNNTSDAARLYSATGAQLIKVAATTCTPAWVAVLHDSLAWITLSGTSCHGHRLAIATPHRKTQLSRQKLAADPPIAALGAVIVDNRNHTELLAYTRPNRHRVIEQLTPSGSLK